MAEGPGLEFSDEDKLRAWLETQPRETGVILAARAALRVAPAVSRELHTGRAPEDRPRRFARSIAAMFRATAIGRVAGAYPTRPIAATRAAAYAANAGHAAADAAADAGLAAAYAADAGLAAAYVADAADAAAYAATATATAAAAATAYAAAAYAAAAPRAAAWRELSRDATLLAGGASPLDLAAAPLWAEGAPEWAARGWAEIRAALPQDEDWSVWIDWYERRLKGVADGEAVEAVFADVPPVLWDKGPATANAWIKAELEKLAAQRTRDEDAAATAEAAETRVAEKTQGVFEPTFADDGRLAARHITAQDGLESQYGFSTAELYDDTRDCLEAFFEHLQSAGGNQFYAQKLAPHVERLRAAFPDELARCQPMRADRALSLALDALVNAERDGLLPENDLIHRHHAELRGQYERLAAYFPRLVDYREATRRNRFRLPDAAARQALDAMLETVAADAATTPELSRELRDGAKDIAAVEAALPPGASEERARSDSYKPMKSGVAQALPLWRFIAQAPEKAKALGKSAEETAALIEKFNKLKAALAPIAPILIKWVESWWV